MTCYEFAPDVFAKLRALDGFNGTHIKESMDP